MDYLNICFFIRTCMLTGGGSRRLVGEGLGSGVQVAVGYCRRGSRERVQDGSRT
jgi:hypothetical protein